MQEPFLAKDRVGFAESVLTELNNNPAVIDALLRLGRMSSVAVGWGILPRRIALGSLWAA